MHEIKETIGQRLKHIRLSRQISIEKAAEATRVRTLYLQALEADNYSAMSSPAQGRGFLRLYADYLGLDLEAAMNELRQGDSLDAPPETPEPATQTPVPILAPQTPPASPADGEPARRPFWSRLLRRTDSQPPTTEEPASEAAPESAPEPVTVPATEPAPTRVKKPAANKAKPPAKIAKPKTAKPTATVKKADKKKASLKSEMSKKHG